MAEIKRSSKYSAYAEKYGFEPTLLKKFRDADDAMQGIFGYQLFVNSAIRCASIADVGTDIKRNRHIISGHTTYRFPLTHVWFRYFSPERLTQDMSKGYESYLAFTSLTNLVSIFDTALRDFFAYAKDNSKKKHELPNLRSRNYSVFLEGVFKFVIDNRELIMNGRKDPAREKMIEEVPDRCCNIDEARRVRNCFVHNLGFFDEKYDKAVLVEGRDAEKRSEFKEWRPGIEIRIPMSFTKYVEYSRSHIELLHDVHDLIQRLFFTHDGSGYSYAGDEKIIDWRRVFNP